VKNARKKIPCNGCKKSLAEKMRKAYIGKKKEGAMKGDAVQESVYYHEKNRHY